MARPVAVAWTSRVPSAADSTSIRLSSRRPISPTRHAGGCGRTVRQDREGLRHELQGHFREDFPRPRLLHRQQRARDSRPISSAILPATTRPICRSPSTSPAAVSGLHLQLGRPIEQQEVSGRKKTRPRPSSDCHRPRDRRLRWVPVPPSTPTCRTSVARQLRQACARREDRRHPGHCPLSIGAWHRACEPRPVRRGFPVLGNHPWPMSVRPNRRCSWGLAASP